MEEVRDRVGNCITVCVIENLDPIDVHTGDSITCAAEFATHTAYLYSRGAGPGDARGRLT